MPDPSAIAETIRQIHTDVLSQGKLDLVGELYAENFTFTGREGTGTRDDVSAYIRQWRTAFPDLTSTVDRVVIDGNQASWSEHYSGTNSEEWNGQPATRRTVTDILSMHEGTFNDRGQLVSHRMVTDEVSERMQLGLLPETPVLGTGPTG